MSDLLSQPNEQLNALLEAAVDAIIISNKQGRILRFNSAAQRLFGYSPEQVINQNLEMLMMPREQSEHAEYMKHYVDGGRPAIIGIGREVSAKHAHGHEIPIHLSVGEIKGHSEARFVGIIRDLSAQKRAEEDLRNMKDQLAHADRLVVLGELLAGIAHEINQPLTAIAAYADAGARLTQDESAAANEELGHICTSVSEQARRAADVVSRLRSLSRKGEVSKSPHDIKLLVANVLLLFEHQLNNSRIDLTTRFSDPLPLVVVDEIQIQQVLTNLVKNSLDALAESDQTHPCVFIDVSATDDFVSIAVSDNGPGVTAENQPHLFNSFFTTKSHGVGLGLSICRSIATAHGGSLIYRPHDHSGARFELNLPLDFIG